MARTSSEPGSATRSSRSSPDGPRAPTLILAHTSSSPARAAEAIRATRERAAWIFLGRSYPRLLEWERSLDGLAERVPAGPAIARYAAELRRPFLRLMDGLERENGSVEWWTSRVSERNTAFSHLFLHCCYLHAARAAADEAEALLVACESWEVLE